MSFNFGSLATTQSVSNVQQRLKPWDIYPVKFVGARVERISGKKDPNAVYDILKVRFEGESGYYEESIFFPKPEDTKRPVYQNKEGHDYEGASAFERTMTFIAQVAGVLNPEGFKKMQEQSSKFRNFDDVAKAFIAVTDKAKGKETHLKLVGGTSNGQVIPKLPKFVAVTKTGEAFTCDNFIGDKLFFSEYENSRRAEYMNAKPTTVGNPVVTTDPVNNFDNTSTEAEEEIDFNSLL